MPKIAEVIKYEGDNSTFIWKHPLEDFNSLTQLVVHESQEAIFMMNGQALDLFGPGRYTLKTQAHFTACTDGNREIICRLHKLNLTVRAPFNCQLLGFVDEINFTMKRRFAARSLVYVL